MFLACFGILCRYELDRIDPTQIRIAFCAQKVSLSPTGRAIEDGDVQLYLLDSRGIAAQLLHSDLEPLHPKFVDARTIIYVDHSRKTLSNTLCRYDLLTKRKRQLAKLPPGIIQRMRIEGGKYTFLFYANKGVEQGTQVMSARLVILKNFHKIYDGKNVADAGALDVFDDKIILLQESKLSTMSSIGDELRIATLPTHVAGARRLLATNARDLTVLGVKSNGDFEIHEISVSASSSRLLRTYVPLFSRAKDYYFSPGDATFYNSDLVDDRQYGRVLVVCSHSMSDGLHDETYELVAREKLLTAVCKGAYLASGPEQSTIAFVRDWVGTYMKGGRRIGRLRLEFRSKMKAGRFLSAQDMDVKGVTAIAG